MTDTVPKQYGRTISIRHFLNTELKPRLIPYKSGVVEAYPLYVKITVKRQNSKFRSQVWDFVPVDQFNKFKQLHQKQLAQEIANFRSIIEQAKPYDTPDFNLTNVLQMDRKSIPDYEVIGITVRDNSSNPPQTLTFTPKEFKEWKKTR